MQAIRIALSTNISDVHNCTLKCLLKYCFCCQRSVNCMLVANFGMNECSFLRCIKPFLSFNLFIIKYIQFPVDLRQRKKRTVHPWVMGLKRFISFFRRKVYHFAIWLSFEEVLGKKLLTIKKYEKHDLLWACCRFCCRSCLHNYFLLQVSRNFDCR